MSEKYFYHVWRTDNGEGTTLRNCTAEQAEEIRERHYGHTGKVVQHLEKDIHVVMEDFSRLRGQHWGPRNKVRLHRLWDWLNR